MWVPANDKLPHPLPANDKLPDPLPLSQKSSLSASRVQKVGGWDPFGVGAPPILVYFSGDWDVHWGYDLDFDPRLVGGGILSKFSPAKVDLRGVWGR